MTADTRTRLERDGDIAVIILAAPPVNALSTAVRAGVVSALADADADPAIRATILIGDGPIFSAGADITEFGKPPREPTLPDMIAAIEAAAKPVIAAIHGTALGGGLETALGADRRVAVPSAKLGLPEIKLGLLPGAGGTQRLPRLIGVERALDLITSGTPIIATEAHAIGLVDALAPEDDLRAFATDYARRIADEPRRRARDRTAAATPDTFAAFRRANARKFRGLDAPERNIQAIEAAVSEPFEQGLDTERRLFIELLHGTQSRAQRHAFFAERQAAKIPGLDPATPVRPIRRVGVIGAGTMGGGISMNFLSAGIPVTLVETSATALDRGTATIRRNYEATAAKGRLTTEQVEANIARLSPGLSLDALADCDLIIEAVFEDMAIKRDIFAHLDRIARPGAILASNTSYLDIDEIASVTGRPEDVLGLHFFSPANVMRLLEIVRGAKTAPDVLATALQLARTIGKVGVVAGVCHGFIGNRMLALRQREANALILEGAMPWDVDRVLTDFGMPMGPFQMADLAGLDIGWSRDTSRGETLRDKLCELDRRGQKTGAGFYDYGADRSRTPSPIVERLVLEQSEARGVARRAIVDEEILERCTYVMINEGARILEEGKAYRASDIDVVWINGYGWPVYRGGPMFHADIVGLRTVVDRLRAFAARSEADYTPAALLVEKAERGETFSAA